MPKGNAAKINTLTDRLLDGTHYLALFTTNPGANGSGTEASYAGYTRRPITFGSPAINGSVAEIKNTNLIEFTTVPSGGGGSIAYCAIMESSSGNTVIYYGPLGATYTLLTGVKPTVPIGSLTITEN